MSYDRSVIYDERSQAVGEKVTQRQGSDTITAETTTDYGSGTAYALGAPVSVTTSATRNGQQGATSRTSFTYEYFDGPLQSTITYTPDINGSVNQTTNVQYTGQGVLFSATINDARPRTVTYEADALGQVIRRDESDNRPTTGDPHEIWFRFDGRELGHVSNNGTLETDYATSVANRTAAPGTGPFRGGATTPSSYADFGSSFQPINSYDQGSDGGIYTVRTGDTLQSIAQRLYGDETLWYKIAQANGLSVDSQLVEGQILNLPRGVVRSANSSTTFRPYDPNAVAGDLIPDETSPTQPQPQARRRRNKCGILGKILLAVVAIAVTALTFNPLVGFATNTLGLGAVGGAIVGGALAGAAGSVASQTVGVATGIQDRFSFKDVTLSALAGGVGAGKVLGSGSSFLGSVARGAAGNAITQGIAVVTGLQSKFDFTGVAVAGLGAGVGRVVRTQFGEPRAGSFGVRLAGASARAIASAATRSVVDGSSFGDNLVASLPDVIGDTVGGLIERSISGLSPAERARRAEAARNGPMQGSGSTGSVDEAQAGGMSGSRGTGSVGSSANSDAQPGDIVVVGDRELGSLFRNMTDYQFGRYEGRYGDIGFRDGAIWASGLSGPPNFTFSNAATGQFSSPLLNSLRQQTPYQTVTFGGRDYRSTADAVADGMTYVTNAPSREAVMAADARRAFFDSYGPDTPIVIGAGPIAYAMGADAVTIRNFGQADMTAGSILAAAAGISRPIGGIAMQRGLLYPTTTTSRVTAATENAGGLTFGRKLDFLFNNGIDQSNPYNAARAAGNAERIGIADTVANRAEVTRRFEAAYQDPSSIVGPGKVPGSNVREFFLPGVTSTGSKITFVEKQGKIITIIAK